MAPGRRFKKPISFLRYLLFASLLVPLSGTRWHSLKPTRHGWRRWEKGKSSGFPFVPRVAGGSIEIAFHLRIESHFAHGFDQRPSAARRTLSGKPGHFGLDIRSTHLEEDLRVSDRRSLSRIITSAAPKTTSPRAVSWAKVNCSGFTFNPRSWSSQKVHVCMLKEFAFGAVGECRFPAAAIAGLCFARRVSDFRDGFFLVQS